MTLRQGMAEDLIVEDGVCIGIVTKTGAEYRAESVVVTTGTYLRGKVIMGELMYESGPNNQQPSVKLSRVFEAMALILFDLKRVHRRACMGIRLILAKQKFNQAMRNRNFSLTKREYSDQ